MLNFNRILMTVCATSSMVLAACGATTAADGDATDGTGSDATTGDTATDTAMGDMSMTATYKSIVIVDKSADPAFINGACGKSPGTDLDAVGLYRAGKLIAVGKPGTANYDKSNATSCAVDANSDKAKATSAEGPVNAHVYPGATPDTGYICLNGGSLEIQFGACVTGSKITDCDGAGALVDVMSGDEIDVWEVDQSYKTGSGTAADGLADSSCVCRADEYNVSVRMAVGQDKDSLWLPATGTYAGSFTVKIP